MRAAIPLERGPVLQLLIRLTCTMFDTKPLLPLSHLFFFLFLQKLVFDLDCVTLVLSSCGRKLSLVCSLLRASPGLHYNLRKEKQYKRKGNLPKKIIPGVVNIEKFDIKGIYWSTIL